MPAAFEEAPDSDQWTFTLQPYLWAIGLSGDIGIKGFGPVHTNTNAKSVLQHLDWGVMARGEVRKGRLGLLGDGMFSQLSASGNPAGPLYQSAYARVQQGMASLALSYRVIEGRQGFLDLYGGARFNYMGINLGGDPDSERIQRISDSITRPIGQSLAKAIRTDPTLVESLGHGRLRSIASNFQKNSGAYRELVSANAQMQAAQASNEVTPEIQRRVANAEKKFFKELAKKIEEELPTSVNRDQWWVDPIVGLRGQVNVTRWLFFAAQGDVGGFGAASDFAAMAQATVGVNLTRNIFAELGYRYFYMDYSNSGLIYQAAEYGIFSGIGITF